MVRAEGAEKLALERANEISQGLERLKTANELVDTARYYIEEQRWDTAAQAFTMAIDLRPEHGPAWEGRGMLYALLGLWDLAASDLAQAAHLQEPVTGNRWFLLALTRAYVGDVAGYRAAFSRMDELLQGATVNHFTMELVRAGALAPDSAADPARLVDMAQAIVAVEPRVHWFLYALGAAHYRARQYEQAIERLHESLEVDPGWSGRAINYPFLAMAYYRLGRHDDARSALDAAQAAIDQWNKARYEASGREYWVVSQGATVFWPILWWDWMACELTLGEARHVMGLPPRPNDSRVRVLRARAFAGLRWPDKAVAEYAHALEESTNDQQIRLEAHRTRGYWYASQRQLQQAAAEYARASEFEPDEPYFWWYQALLHLAAGDQQSYRRICAATLERFRSTQDPRTAHSVVSTCTLLPDALPDMGELVPVGHVAARWYPGAIRMLAAAQCRAGNHAEAVRGFEDAATHYRLRADDWLLQAIAHYHLGDTDQAQHCLNTALEWIHQADRRQLNDPAGTQPGWGDWHEPIWIPILRREVESRLKVSQ
jgi:tetratricopeptide (TPR) repeat protein